MLTKYSSVIMIKKSFSFFSALEIWFLWCFIEAKCRSLCMSFSTETSTITSVEWRSWVVGRSFILVEILPQLLKTWLLNWGCFRTYILVNVAFNSSKFDISTRATRLMWDKSESQRHLTEPDLTWNMWLRAVYWQWYTLYSHTLSVFI